jgi:hypothetical protein
MDTVLSHIYPAEKAKADFDIGVVRITATEYETRLPWRRQPSHTLRAPGERPAPSTVRRRGKFAPRSDH